MVLKHAFSHLRATREEKVQAKFVDERLLVVKGRSFDRVEVLGAVFNPITDDFTHATGLPAIQNGMQKLLALIAEAEGIASEFEPSSPLSGIQGAASSRKLSPNCFDQLWRSIIWNTDIHGSGFNHPPPAEFGVRFLEVIHAVKVVRSGERLSVETNWRVQEILPPIEQAIFGGSVVKRFGRTSKRDLGSFPKNAQPGDKIATFYGGNVLYVVRPAEEGKYTFIGDCSSMNSCTAKF
jgi:hypothetical protein